MVEYYGANTERLVVDCLEKVTLRATWYGIPGCDIKTCKTSSTVACNGSFCVVTLFCLLGKFICQQDSEVSQRWCIREKVNHSNHAAAWWPQRGVSNSSVRIGGDA